MSYGLIDCVVRVGHTVVLNRISLEIPENRMLALMGPSGAGKTTVLRVLGGELAPESGGLSLPEGFEDIAWVPQSAPVLPRRSAMDNVALGALSKGLPLLRSKAIATIALRDVGLDHLSTRRAKTLSGGERQRVAVARALASGSRLVLADEPTASLDALSRDAVARALRAVCSRGGTVVVATHDQAVADQCDTIVQLEDGRVRADRSRYALQ